MKPSWASWKGKRETVADLPPATAAPRRRNFVEVLFARPTEFTTIVLQLSPFDLIGDELKALGYYWADGGAFRKLWAAKGSANTPEGWKALGRLLRSHDYLIKITDREGFPPVPFGPDLLFLPESPSCLFPPRLVGRVGTAGEDKRDKTWDVGEDGVLVAILARKRYCVGTTDDENRKSAEAYLAAFHSGAGKRTPMAVGTRLAKMLRAGDFDPDFADRHEEVLRLSSWLSRIGREQLGEIAPTAPVRGLARAVPVDAPLLPPLPSEPTPEPSKPAPEPSTPFVDLPRETVAAILRRVADDLAGGKFATVSEALSEFQRRVEVVKGIL